MTLIPISHEYSIIIESYASIQVGDIIKSQSQLRKMICYPAITSEKANSGTVKRLQPIIDTFIRYEKQGGNKIKITDIQPVHIMEEQIQKQREAVTTPASRITYKPNRTAVLDYIIGTYPSETLYITTLGIIQQAVLFQDFFYEYSNIHYDSHHSTAEEVRKLSDFVQTYAITDPNYLIRIMDLLSDILYKMFKADNIESWAENRKLAFERVLFQKGEPLDETTAEAIEAQYIQPQIDKRVPAKSRIKLANRQYMTDHGISPVLHEWFYYVYKFTKPEAFTAEVTEAEYIHHCQEISRKAITRLRAMAVDPRGGDYHKKNAHNFEEIMSKMLINEKIVQ